MFFGLHIEIYAGQENKGLLRSHGYCNEMLRFLKCDFMDKFLVILRIVKRSDTFAHIDTKITYYSI